MGYFSNGTEGMMYEEAYCEKCLHNKEDGCPVWVAHLLFNYKECNNESILDILIPREDDGVFNKQCAMFIDRRQKVRIDNQKELILGRLNA